MNLQRRNLLVTFAAICGCAILVLSRFTSLAPLPSVSNSPGPLCPSGLECCSIAMPSSSSGRASSSPVPADSEEDLVREHEALGTRLEALSRAMRKILTEQALADSDPLSPSEQVSIALTAQPVDPRPILPKQMEAVQQLTTVIARLRETPPERLKDTAQSLGIELDNFNEMNDPPRGLQPDATPRELVALKEFLLRMKTNRLDQERARLDELRQSAATYRTQDEWMADYQQLKGEYLSIKAHYDELSRRLRLTPLPSNRVRDWRLPAH